jgi:hypothetical protein
VIERVRRPIAGKRTTAPLSRRKSGKKKSGGANHESSAQQRKDGSEKRRIEVTLVKLVQVTADGLELLRKSRTKFQAKNRRG